MAYLRRLYRLPAEREEALVADLWDQGTLGTSSEEGAGGLLTVAAYFPAGPPPPPAAGFDCIAEELIADTDWLAFYRRHARPFPLGRTFWIDPGEPSEPVPPGLPRLPAPAAPHSSARQGLRSRRARSALPPPPAPPGRRLLRLPARTAFGTGSHESTALAVELLEAEPVRGCAVLDVGTGTGILCFAALLLGAARAVGFDCDLAAAAAAYANARLNRLRPAPLFFAGRLAAVAPRPARARFDLALANVVPEQLLPELAALPPLLRPGGTVILSGLLAGQVKEVLARTRALGFSLRARRRRGEWVALRFVLTPERHLR